MRGFAKLRAGIPFDATGAHSFGVCLSTSSARKLGWVHRAPSTVAYTRTSAVASGAGWHAKAAIYPDGASRQDGPGRQHGLGGTGRAGRGCNATVADSDLSKYA